MADALTIDVEVDELIRTIGLLEFRVKSRTASLITKYVVLIAADAQARAPVGATGKLRKGIKTYLKQVLTDLAGEVRVTTFYGLFIEMGTRKLAARPFLIPAFEAHANPFLRELKNILANP